MDNSNDHLKPWIGAWEDGYRNIDDFVKSPHAVCCAASFVVAAYEKYASLLRICAPCLRTFYEAVNIKNE